MPAIPTEELSKGTFEAIKDSLTGSPIWLVLLGLAVTLFAGWVNSNKEQIEDNQTLRTIVVVISVAIGIFLIYLLISLWP
jgi:uncharacterized membrane protein